MATTVRYFILGYAASHTRARRWLQLSGRQGWCCTRYWPASHRFRRENLLSTSNAILDKEPPSLTAPLSLHPVLTGSLKQRIIGAQHQQVLLPGADLQGLTWPGSAEA